jgi:predicted ribosomally synthesized peptide with nif11-like leader
MSIQHAVDFCERLVKDSELRNKARAIIGRGATGEDIVGLGALHGFVFTPEELERASQGGAELSDAELQTVAGGLTEEQYADAQLADVDLQTTLQKQQQTLQMMSNISKMVYDSAQSTIRKIGG